MNENERSGTIGLDWLGIGCGEGLVPSAWPSPDLFPHSPLPQSLSSPHSTSIWPYLNHIQLHHLILHEIHIHHFHLHILFLHIQYLSSPLVTSNFTSITFCYESKSPWPISVSAPFALVIPTSSCLTRWVVSGSG